MGNARRPVHKQSKASIALLAIFVIAVGYSILSSDPSETLPFSQLGRRDPDADFALRDAYNSKSNGGDASAFAARGDGMPWWKNVHQDPATCGIIDAQPAELLQTVQRPAASLCRQDCRATDGCTGWFWCDDSAGCADWQTGQRVGYRACLLLTADPRPQPEPKLEDVTAPNGFFSYQAGYIKGDLYMRPPHVTVATAIEWCNPDGPDPAHQFWKEGDWLNWISIANKQDYARLHGFDFIMTAVKSKESWVSEDLTKVDLILRFLLETAGRDRSDWLLWVEQNAFVLNPAYSLPFARYERSQHDIIMYGDNSMTVAGHVNGFDPGVVLMRNTPEVLAFWREVNATLHNRPLMTEGMKELSDLNNQNNYLNYRNAMAILLKRSPTRWLNRLIYFENSFCISCFYENADLHSPTMFITHFIDVSHCNDFSLSKDDARWPLYNDLLLKVYRLSRCKHTVALRHGGARALLSSSAAALPSRTELPASHVIVAARDNMQSSTAACRRACAQEPSCTAWIYCWQPGGCDDGRDTASGAFPEGGCELYRLPGEAPLPVSGRGPCFSSFASGFTRRHHRTRRRDIEGLQVREMPLPNVVVAMAIPDDPCAVPAADHINALSVGNKQDWAALHGFEVHLAAGLVDANVTHGNWNKEAMIRKVLSETPREDAEWILWVDVDTVMPAVEKLPRFDEYQGKDLVVWGDAAKLARGNMNGGINCGVLLIRNTDWSRKFFADVGKYAYMDRATLDAKMRPVLEKEISPLLPGFFDTPFIVWLLKTRPEYRSKVFFEDQLGINRHWLQIDWTKEADTLVAHYAGCTFCKPPLGKLAEPVITACNREFYKAYAYSRCRLVHQYFEELPACSYESEDLSWITIRLGS